MVDELTYPTAVAFDDKGVLYVAESGFSPGPARAPARIIRINGDGDKEVFASGFNGPLTGLVFHKGFFYVADGGTSGRIIRVGKDGKKKVLVQGLPTGGDHPTGDIAVGKDGRLYFGVGTVTNAGVVGPDNFLQGWLASLPRLHDFPTRTFRLSGIDFVSQNPLLVQEGAGRTPKESTGAFVPFGSTTSRSQVVKKAALGNGAIYRVKTDGSGLEVFADGLRNPVGLRFSPQGKLVATNQGFENRGSRPVANDWDTLWEIRKGGWYGWPDFASGMSVTDARFSPEKGAKTKKLLQTSPKLAGKPKLKFAPDSGVQGLDFSTSDAFGFKGQAFVAQFGSLAPPTGPGAARAKGKTEGPAGFRVVRADLKKGTTANFLVNTKPGPEGTGPERPVQVRFDPSGKSLYVVDFGVVEVNRGAIVPRALTGAVWRIQKTAAQAATQAVPAGATDRTLLQKLSTLVGTRSRGIVVAALAIAGAIAIGAGVMSRRRI